MVHLADDMSAGARFVAVGGDGLVGDEVPIVLDGKAELAADRDEFRKRDIAELLGPHPGPSPSGPACVGSKRLLPF